MALTRDQIQVAQGALYLIDHIGQPPPDIKFRHFTEQAMKDHLEQHTYYHRGPGGPNSRDRVTLAWMRRYMRELFTKATASFYQPGSSTTMDDRSDKVFRKGTTEGFPDRVLKRFMYDRATFSEAELPGYEGGAGLADDDEEDAVKEDEITKTNNTKLESRKRVRDSLVHFVSSKKLRTGATHITSPSRSSQKSFRTSADMESEKDEDDDNDRYSSYSDANEALGIQNDQAELYLQAQASANLLTRVKPTTARATTSEEEESAPQVQSPERRGGGLLKRQAPYPAATPTAATKPVPLPLPSATKDSNAPQAPSRNALDNVLSQIKRRNGSNLEQTESKQPSVRASVESGKRKRGNEDLGDAIEYEVAIKPTERKKSKTSIKIGPSRHPQVVIPGAASPLRASSQPTLDTSTVLENDMQGAEHASDGRSVENEIRDPQPSQPAVSSQDGEQQPQPVPFDIEQQGIDFGGFYSRLERATDRVIDSIGRSISDFLSPMAESPSERLEALYKRCLGPDWEAVRVQLTRDKTFTASDIAMSVISAFLFENVLNQQASIQDIRAKLLELGGTMGRAILRTLNLESNGTYSINQFEVVHR